MAAAIVQAALIPILETLVTTITRPRRAASSVQIVTEAAAVIGEGAHEDRAGPRPRQRPRPQCRRRGAASGSADVGSARHCRIANPRAVVRISRAAADLNHGDHAQRRQVRRGSVGAAEERLARKRRLWAGHSDGH